MVGLGVGQMMGLAKLTVLLFLVMKLLEGGVGAGELKMYLGSEEMLTLATGVEMGRVLKLVLIGRMQELVL